jgi:hypothetical protein
MISFLKKILKSSTKSSQESKVMSHDQITVPAQAGAYVLLKFVFIDRKVTAEFCRAELLAAPLPILAWKLIDDLPLPITLGSNQQQIGTGVDAIMATGSGMIYATDGTRVWRGIDSFVGELIRHWEAWRVANKPPPPARPPLVAGTIVAGSRPVGFIDETASTLVG